MGQLVVTAVGKSVFSKGPVFSEIGRILTSGVADSGASSGVFNSKIFTTSGTVDRLTRQLIRDIQMLIAVWAIPFHRQYWL